MTEDKKKKKRTECSDGVCRIVDDLDEMNS